MCTKHTHTHTHTHTHWGGGGVAVDTVLLIELLACVLSTVVTLPLYLILSADVITIEKTGENFRLLFDVKGRFAIHRIGPEEAKVGGASSTRLL